MTDPNIYGTRAETKYDFAGWTWGGEIPENLIELLSIQAAQLVVEEMAKDAHIWLTTDGAGTSTIELSCLDGHVSFEVPFQEVVDQWLASRAGGPNDDIHPDDAKELVAALELALRKIKARI